MRLCPNVSHALPGQVALLSEVVGVGLRSMSDTVLLARVLAMALTLLLIHLAVQLCNGLQVGNTHGAGVLLPHMLAVHMLAVPRAAGGWARCT